MKYEFITRSLNRTEKGNVEVAVGGFIGFFPFGFFSSKKAFWMWLALAALSAVLIAIWLLSRKS